MRCVSRPASGVASRPCSPSCLWPLQLPHLDARVTCCCRHAGVWRAHLRRDSRARQRGWTGLGSSLQYTGTGPTPATSAPGPGSPLQCTGTGRAPATSALGLISPLQCTRTGPTPATSAPGLARTAARLDRARRQLVGVGLRDEDGRAAGRDEELAALHLRRKLLEPEGSRRRCGPSPGADVGRVPAQMWAESRRRCGPSPGADVRRRQYECAQVRGVLAGGTRGCIQQREGGGQRGRHIASSSLSDCARRACSSAPRPLPAAGHCLGLRVNPPLFVPHSREG